MMIHFTLKIYRDRLSRLALLLTLTALAGGCASPPLQYSGFFGDDYSYMQVDSSRPDSAIWRKPNTPLTNYRKVMIDEPMVFLSLKAKDRQLDPDLRDRLIDEMRAALTEKLGGSFLVVQEPGPDTLRVRAAITGVMPTGNPGARSSPIIERVPIMFEESHMEAEVLDSLTVERLMAMVDSRRGRNLAVVQEQVRWEAVRALTREWAESLRRALTAQAR